jgi:hypothetical protein
MESQLSKNNLLKMGFTELEVINSLSELKFFKKKSVFVIFIERGSFGYLLQRDSAFNDRLKPIYTIQQLKVEYNKIAGQELMLYSFSDN